MLRGTLKRYAKRYGWMVGSMLLIAVLWPSVGLCADLKMGYVLSERIFTEYKAYADAQAEFEKFKADWEKRAQDMEAELATLQEEYEQQRLLLSEQKAKEKEEEIRTKGEALQKFVNEILSPEGKLAQKNMELSKPIYDKINAVVAKIGEEEQYDFIFDASTSGLLWAAPDKGYDLTDKVIEVLNKETE